MEINTVHIATTCLSATLFLIHATDLASAVDEHAILLNSFKSKHKM